MPAVSETIVREYFELHGFLVRQHRKFIARNRKADDEDDIDFFVLNPQPQPRPVEFPFVLTSVELAFVNRAIVVVKGWHTERSAHAVDEPRRKFFDSWSQKCFNRRREPLARMARRSRFWLSCIATGFHSARGQYHALAFERD